VFFDTFWDDCGAQSHHYGWKSYHLRGNLAEERFLQDGVYGMRRRVHGKRITIPLDPQPTEVVCVHTLYTNMARDITYRQRITYVDGIAMYAAEYLGKFPANVETHGNVTKSSGEYMCTRPETTDAIVQEVSAHNNRPTPRRVYQLLHLVGDGDGPRNAKQVRNISQHVRTGTTMKSSANLADEIQMLLTRLASEDEDFVEGVQCLLRRTPALYYSQRTR